MASTMRAILVVAVGFLLAGCSESAAPGPAGGEDGRLRVVATLPALAWIAEGLVPEAEVTTLLGPGGDPHGFEPTPGQAREIAEADIVLTVGFGLDAPVGSILARTERGGRVSVTLQEAARARWFVDAAEGTSAGAGPANDPHAWLDPMVMERAVIDAAAAIADVFGPADGLEERRDVLIELARRVDDSYRARLGRIDDPRIVTHHNAWAYICDRYGLRVVGVVRPIELLEPTPNDLMTAIVKLKEIGARALFVEPAYDGPEAKRVADAAGVELIVLDPIGDGDWPAMMMRNLEALERGLAEKPE